MKKLVLFAIAFVFGAFAANAQDIITLKDGTDIKAKVTEVTGTEVKYKKFSNPDGPTFVIPKSDILVVRYENGENEVMGNAGSNTASDYTPYTTEDIRPGMKYKELKKIYDFHEYVRQPGDRYSRGWAGVASALIPGLGEGIDGEWGRAALVCGANIGLSLLQNTQKTKVIDDEALFGYYYERTPFYYVIGAAKLALNVWSVVDAVRIAKVKNMYYQDLYGRRTAVDFDFEPFITCAPAAGNNLQPVAGLSMRVAF